MTTTDAAHPRAVLVGPPGAGKSTVGRLLADALGVPFLDTDARVEETAGCSIAEIFLESGEPAFRELERDAVLAALATHPGVLSLGGGAPMTPEVRAALRGHTVVFLDVDIASAAPRVGFDTARPLLQINPRGQWLALMRARRPLYEAVSTHHVDTSGRAPEDVVAEVVTLLTGTPAATEEGR